MTTPRRGLAALLLATTTAACFGAGNVPVEGVSVTPDGLTLLVRYEGCSSGAPVFVTEEDAQVLVRVEREPDRCDAVQSSSVTLDEPLRARRLIDLATNDRIVPTPVDD